MALFRIELGLRVDVFGIIYYMVRVCMVLYGVDYPGITYLLRGVYRVDTDGACVRIHWSSIVEMMNPCRVDVKTAER